MSHDIERSCIASNYIKMEEIDKYEEKTNYDCAESGPWIYNA
jgi:hypothetical protein